MAALRGISSLVELKTLSHKDKRYEQLALTAATNLGYSTETFNEAYRLLQEAANETDEDSVVDEINFCLDCVQ